MGITKNKAVSSRIATAVSALAVAALGIMGAATAAYADDVPGGELGNIDWTRNDAALVIHKHDQGAALGKAGDGTEINITNDPIEGVEFEVTLLEGMDLTKAENWEALKDLDASDVDSLVGGGDTSTLLTGEDGIARFEDLPLGLYLVKETDNSSAKINGQPVALGATAAPWLMVLPTYGTPKGEEKAGWMYEVHAYPKNQVNPLEKKPGEVSGPAVGDNVSWEISAQMPLLSGDNSLQSYAVTDQLDERLTFVGVTDAKLGAADLQADDYTVSPDARGKGGDTVVFSLTKDGLEKVKGGEKLTFTILTEVNEKLDGGKIENDIFAEFEDSEGGEFTVTTPPSTGKPGPKPWVAYGNAVLTKVDSESEKVLKGAEFQVFEHGDRDPENKDLSCEDLVKGNGSPSVGQATSDENGKVTFPFLYVGSSNDKETTRDYLVCESKAPAGYILDKGTPKVVAFDSADLDADRGTFENTPNKPGSESNTLPSLPLTGAAGTMLFLLIGAALLTGGVALRARSKAKQA